MYKLAAVTAVAAASTMEEMKNTAELFTITLHEEEVAPLKHQAKQLQAETMKYDHMMQTSHHGKQFEGEVKNLVHTNEFVALTKYIQHLKKRGPSQQMKEFHDAYMAQMHRLQKAHMKLEHSVKKDVTGKSPHHVATFDVDDDAWIDFNRQYYKVREMEYYAGYKIPEIVAIRGKMRDLKETNEMGDIQEHWHEITQQKQHQVVVHHQGAFVKACVQALHLSEDKWMDPAHSPVMFDTWHAIYLYFVAMAKGDLEPMLDFIIDGTYDKDFVNHVDPKFPAPKNYPDDLYLY